MNQLLDEVDADELLSIRLLAFPAFRSVVILPVDEEAREIALYAEGEVFTVEEFWKSSQVLEEGVQSVVLEVGE
jgi:hypothetical protein